MYIHNRRYLGSKYKLIPHIKKIVEEECGKYEVFCDLFAGTGVVGYAFNDSSTRIIVNDILYSNYLAYITWFGNEYYDIDKISNYIDEFNNIEVTEENYVSKNFGNRYFSMENARKIGAIREEIEKLLPKLTYREGAILITSLLYGLDKVANTCGHYDSYRKVIDTTMKLKLNVPLIEDYKNIGNQIYRLAANELVKKITSDITYIDMPYNSRQYSDTYHLLENIAHWDKPKVYGKSKKMGNRENIKSDYCTTKAPKVFDDLISNINSRYIIVSYSNMAKKGDERSNAKISDEEMIESLNKRGKVITYQIDYNYYTTGKTDIEDYKERIFLCKCR